MFNWFDRDQREVFRSFKLTNGNTLNFHRHPPSGFWTIQFGNGTTPINIAGRYQNFDIAFAAAKFHLENKTKPNPILEEVWPDQ